MPRSHLSAIADKSTPSLRCGSWPAASRRRKSGFPVELAAPVPLPRRLLLNSGIGGTVARRPARPTHFEIAGDFLAAQPALRIERRIDATACFAGGVGDLGNDLGGAHEIVGGAPAPCHGARRFKASSSCRPWLGRSIARGCLRLRALHEPRRHRRVCRKYLRCEVRETNAASGA